MSFVAGLVGFFPTWVVWGCGEERTLMVCCVDWRLGWVRIVVYVMLGNIGVDRIVHLNSRSKEQFIIGTSEDIIYWENIMIVQTD